MKNKSEENKNWPDDSESQIENRPHDLGVVLVTSTDDWVYFSGLLATGNSPPTSPNRGWTVTFSFDQSSH